LTPFPLLNEVKAADYLVNVTRSGGIAPAGTAVKRLYILLINN